jgi:hypothetical protein
VSSNDVGSIGSLYQKKGNLRNTPTTRAVQTVWGADRYYACGLIG